MNAVQREVWSRVKERGFARFLLRSIGITACIYAAIPVLCEFSGTTPFRWNWNSVSSWVGLALFTGVVSGIVEWLRNEKNYDESGAEAKDS